MGKSIMLSGYYIPLDVIRIDLFNAIIRLDMKTIYSAIIVFRQWLSQRDIRVIRRRLLVFYDYVLPNGWKQGPHKEYNNGCVYKVNNYINNKRQGKQIQYYLDSAVIYRVYHMFNDQLHGKYVSKNCKNMYKHDLTHGKQEVTYSDGRRKVYYMINGVKQGYCIVYDESKTIIKEVHYKDGLKNGLYINHKYQKNKLTWMGILKCNYKAGKLHGKYVLKDEDAWLTICRCNYNDGLLEGEYTSYNYGTMLDQCTYVIHKVNGQRMSVRHGPARIYDDETYRVYVGEYIYGNQIGPVKVYSEDNHGEYTILIN